MFTVDSATQNLLIICKNAVEQSKETDGEQTMELQPVVIEDSMESQNNSNSCSNKKGFSVWESCKNVMKKLGSSSTVASQSTNVEKMITDYLNEPPLEGPKLKFVKSLEYWKSHDQHFSVLANISRKYLSSPPGSIASESLFGETVFV